MVIFTQLLSFCNISLLLMHKPTSFILTMGEYTIPLYRMILFPFFQYFEIFNITINIFVHLPLSVIDTHMSSCWVLENDTLT